MLTHQHRIRTGVCAAVIAGAALALPAVGSASAQEGSRPTATAGSSTAKEYRAAQGFHSKKGLKSCSKRGETVFLSVKAALKYRFTWKSPGGKLHSQHYWNASDGTIGIRKIPTWRKDVYWKVTALPGKDTKTLVKVYAYCSKTGL
ncbi:hypothetical protein OG302_33445 [Streptomyces sp. NBC_01283]|uniref:hypothetical protein n=1 Tax=Streptomyces sp. NBC_01283 TaxID=2903812 RepID=UPI00352C99B0|nr:hypothetical protein OG302_33445 [Streptomyces sp. NBC_01283]